MMSDSMLILATRRDLESGSQEGRPLHCGERVHDRAARCREIHSRDGGGPAIGLVEFGAGYTPS